MTAISKSWVAIADGQVDPDSPIDAALMQGLRDDLVHLREWIGASYTAGAVQNHSHDGVDSALVPIGANALRNGSFESDLIGWTTATYTGGTVAINTANAMDGLKCLACTSTVVANGGGTATSNEYLPCATGRAYTVRALVAASVANVSHHIGVIWYNSAKTQISITTAESSANTPTSQANVGSIVVAPANARFMRLILIGGEPGVGSATGTVIFDGVTLIDGAISTYQVFTSTGAWVKPYTVSGDERVIVEIWGAGGGSSVVGAGGGGGGAYARNEFLMSALASSYTVTIGAGGAAGVAGGNSSFGSLLLAYGGGGGANPQGGGGGGTAGAGGTPTNAGAGFNTIFDAGGAGGGAGAAGGQSVWGGGGGGGYNGAGVGGNGGNSVWGGAGGRAAGVGGLGAVGMSLFGGQSEGGTPGGGGGQTTPTGGRGECRVWIISPRS